MEAPAARLTQAMRALEQYFLIGADGTTEIWLVRHGDCYEDMVDDPDPELSARGRDQAAKLARRVTAWREPPAAVYASPSRRAQETARAIHPNPRTEERIVEMPFELGERGEVVFTETAEDVVRRVTAAVDDIVLAHPGERVIVVGHAGAFFNYLAGLLKIEPGGLRVLLYYTSVSLVRALGDRRMVGSLGDTAHLE